MLQFKLRPINRVCKGLSGGVARIWIYDPEDFAFTQAADDAVTGPQPYTAIALRTGAVAEDGAKLFPIPFSKKGNEAEYRYTQSRKGRANKVEHNLEFFLDDIDQTLAQWNKAVDDAGACNGIGMLIQLNSGKILVAGEKWIGTTQVDIPLVMTQDGSTGTSGKLYDDPNGQTTLMKGDYSRNLYEFTGGLASLIALE